MPAPTARVSRHRNAVSGRSAPRTGDKPTGPARRVRRTLMKLAKRVLPQRVQAGSNSRREAVPLLTPQPAASADIPHYSQASPGEEHSVQLLRDAHPPWPGPAHSSALGSMGDDAGPQLHWVQHKRKMVAEEDGPQLNWVRRKRKMVAEESPDQEPEQEPVQEVVQEPAQEPSLSSRIPEDAEMKSAMDWPEEIVAEANWHFEVLYPHLCQSEVAAQSVIKRSRKNNDTEVRASVVQWMTVQHLEFACSPHVLYLAVQFFDRVLAQQSQSRRWRGRSPIAAAAARPTRLLGAGSLLIAAKFEDLLPPIHQGLADASEGHFKVEEVHPMEVFVVQQLEYRLHSATASHHLEWFQRLCTGGYLCEPQNSLVHYLATLGLCSEDSGQWTAKHHAAGAVLLSHMMLKQVPWPQTFSDVVVAGDEANRRAVRMVAVEIFRVLDSCGPGHSVYDKFALEEFGQASLRAKELLQNFNSILKNGLLTVRPGPTHTSASLSSCVCS